MHDRRADAAGTARDQDAPAFEQIRHEARSDVTHVPISSGSAEALQANPNPRHQPHSPTGSWPISTSCYKITRMRPGVKLYTAISGDLRTFGADFSSKDTDWPRGICQQEGSPRRSDPPPNQSDQQRSRALRRTSAAKGFAKRFHVGVDLCSLANTAAECTPMIRNALPAFVPVLGWRCHPVTLLQRYRQYPNQLSPAPPD